MYQKRDGQAQELVTKSMTGRRDGNKRPFGHHPLLQKTEHIGAEPTGNFRGRGRGCWEPPQEWEAEYGARNVEERMEGHHNITGQV